MQAQIINSIFSLFSPKEDGGEAKSCSSGLFFLLTSPHPKAIQEPTKSCFLRKDSYQEIPRDLGPLCQKQGSMTKDKRCLEQTPLIAKEITKLLGAVAKSLRQRPKSVFLIMSLPHTFLSIFWKAAMDTTIPPTLFSIFCRTIIIDLFILCFKD